VVYYASVSQNLKGMMDWWLFVIPVYKAINNSKRNNKRMPLER
jgi:hypothetical protein